MQTKLKRSMFFSLVVLSAICFGYLNAQQDIIGQTTDIAFSSEFDQVMPDVKILKVIVSKIIDIITLNNL